MADKVPNDEAAIRAAIGAYGQLAATAGTWARQARSVADQLSRAQVALDAPRGCEVYDATGSPVAGAAPVGTPAAGMTGPGIDPMVQGIQAMLRTLPGHSSQLGTVEQFSGLVSEHYAGLVATYRGRVSTLEGALRDAIALADSPFQASHTDVERPPATPEPAVAR